MTDTTVPSGKNYNTPNLYLIKVLFPYPNVTEYNTIQYNTVQYIDTLLIHQRENLWHYFHGEEASPRHK